jgi:hypothetical protein
MALEVDSNSNRNNYQEYFLGGKGGRLVGLTTLPPSCTDFLEILAPQPCECSFLITDFLRVLIQRNICTMDLKFDSDSVSHMAFRTLGNI